MDIEELIRKRRPVSKKECWWCRYGRMASSHPAAEILCDDHLREYDQI